MDHEREPAGTIEVEDRNGVHVVRLLGDHDMATRSALQDVIDRAIAADQGVVISLTETEFIDSGITQALYRGDTLLHDRGRRLVLHVATASVVRRVLELSGLTSDLPSSSSVETAVSLASTRVGDPTWSRP